MSSRDPLRSVVVLVGMSAATTVATFAPWARSGARTRHSYDVVDVAGRAGVVPASLEPFVPTWFLIPVLFGLVLVAGAVSRVRSAAAAAGTLGALVTVGGVLVARSPLAIQPGATIATAAGACTAIAGIAVLVTASRTGRSG